MGLDWYPGKNRWSTCQARRGWPRGHIQALTLPRVFSQHTDESPNQTGQRLAVDMGGCGVGTALESIFAGEPAPTSSSRSTWGTRKGRDSQFARNHPLQPLPGALGPDRQVKAFSDLEN